MIEVHHPGESATGGIERGQAVAVADSKEKQVAGVYERKDAWREAATTDGVPVDGDTRQFGKKQ